jgi:DNA-binding NtrC family response regulator
MTADFAPSTILVVDDHRTIRELFVRFLRELGYEVLEAEGPWQAQWLAAAQGRVDLLLTDFHMPAMNGVQLAQWFQSRFPQGKVLLTSTAPWEVEPYLKELPDLVLLDKKDAFNRLKGILEGLLDRAAESSAQTDPDRLRRRLEPPGPASAWTHPNNSRTGYEYETRMPSEAH